MLLDDAIFRPVKIPGILFVAIAILGSAFHAGSLREPEFRCFIIFMTAWHLSTGLGILFRKIWGFYLLKSYLYFLLLGFPIGTWIAVKSLRYIKEKEIVRFFKSRIIEI